MKLTTSTADVGCPGAGNWVAVGMWDGVHLGHQAIITALVAAARAAGGQAVVVGFDPHPMAVLRPEVAPLYLQTVAERAAVLAALGVDVHLVIPFTPDFAARSPEWFVDQVLVGELCARAVMVGFNFTFGRGGRGTAQTLTDLCARHGVPVRVFAPVRVAGETVSSTAIRYLLAAGQVDRAAEMLGRPFTLSGTVVRGDQRGRTLGYPTANLALAPGRQLPAPGVYAVRVAVLPPGRDWVPPGEPGVPAWPGVLNLGRRPTFRGEDLRCEVHLLDFAGDLYGRRLQVEFVHRLREERAFAGPAELVDQIRRDAALARQVLGAPERSGPAGGGGPGGPRGYGQPPGGGPGQGAGP